MALDVQPLSAQRRVGMVLVLLALFAASLGFAQLLVKRAPQVAHNILPGGPPVPVGPKFTHVIRAPHGFTTAVPEYENLPGAAMTGSGVVEGRPRRYVAFSYPARSVPGLNEQQMIGLEAQRVFERVIGTDTQVQVPQTISTLGAFGAVALEGEYEATNAPGQLHFLMERLTIIAGDVVAICFGGDGPITDPDRAFFKEFCETGVVIRPITPAP